MNLPHLSPYLAKYHFLYRHSAASGLKQAFTGNGKGTNRYGDL